ncbi:hypothetical protein AA12717_2558 [Gluconacetobacter sacchari DSM 12717]|uniref:Uncharacterized protein n=1 Tax=Gluconacetobacter sacchari DSM 12717 TaxID=1307940 RepID=A0ABQ0P8U0_9PROT|nr:hypothetical protein AA12717_2558 [Gluconacetobacter sacchari DSM 12717]
MLDPAEETEGKPIAPPIRPCPMSDMPGIEGIWARAERDPESEAAAITAANDKATK